MTSPVRCGCISRYCAADEGITREGKSILSTVVVRYRPKADRADENKKMVEAVFAELAEADPGGVRYATFRLADGTFIHIADVEADPNPLGSIAAFAEFQTDIADRCEEGEGPNPQAAVLVGNYRLLDA
jgi:hypothetical protein